MNKTKAVKGPISDDMFASFHQHNNMLGYSEQLTGVKNDLIFMVSLNRTLDDLMSNEQANRSVGSEREKMYEKYYQELMRFYTLFKQNSLKQNFSETDIWTMLYGLPWSIDRSICNKALNKVICEGWHPRRATKWSYRKIMAMAKKHKKI